MNALDYHCVVAELVGDFRHVDWVYLIRNYDCYLQPYFAKEPASPILPLYLVSDFQCHYTRIH